MSSAGSPVRTALAACLAAACAGASGYAIAGCGGAPSPSPSPAAPSTSATSPASASPTATSSQDAIDGIPFYQPSSTISRAAGSAVLHSPDPVAKVSAYYVAVVARGGWTTVSSSVTSHSASLTIKRSGQGATISVAPSASGTVISISTYPSP